MALVVLQYLISDIYHHVETVSLQQSAEDFEIFNRNIKFSSHLLFFFKFDDMFSIYFLCLLGQIGLDAEWDSEMFDEI